MHVLRGVFLAAGLLGFAPGAAAQVLEDLSPAAIQRAVAPGDVVQAKVKDGRTFDLRIDKVEAESLTGTTLEQRRFRIRYSALAALEVRSKATAGAGAGGGVVALPPVPKAQRSGMLAWFGLNIGLVSGDIDIPCASRCSEGGVFTSFGANLTFAGPVALRLRAVHANEDTSHPPLETAALVGPRFGQDFYLLVGASTVHNPDDDYPGNADGIAWELLYAPRSLSDTGLEITLHGANGDDLSYSGISIGFRFGKVR
jgi:hypothetical protein